MQIHKRIMSIVLACVLFFTGLPVQFMNFDGIPYAYAEGGTSTVDIRYDNFSNTESLKINGDTLIKDNTIQFESSSGVGESVFTSETVDLGKNQSFSTAFSFRNISPATPKAEIKGGFTFTLQSISNSETASDFHDEDISPSLSIAFTTDYMETGGTASLIEHARNLNLATLADSNLAALSDFTIAEGPMTRCEISAVPYTNGAYDTSVLKWQIDTFYSKDEPSDSYHVWISYDGEEKLLHMLCLTPFGEYRYDNTYMELSEILSSNEVYAGFMGSFENSRGVSEISSWYFKNDLSIFDEAIVDTDEVFLTNDMARLEADPVDYFTLPMYGQFGSTISWKSSNTDVVAEDGTVKLPSIEDGPQVVRLTALVKKGSAVRQTREFKLTIMVPGDLIVNADLAWLTDRVILRDENDSVDNIVSDLYLPTLGHYGSTISWQSSNPDVVAENGWVNRPSYYTGDKEVTLTARIIRNSFEDVKEFNITVKAVRMEDEEMVEADQLWLTERQILNGNSSLDYVTNNLYLPATGQYGSTISWESDNEEIIAMDGTYGTVIRPSLAQGDQKVTLTATIKSNASSRKKSFIATVKVRDEDIVSADDSWLTDTLVLNGNSGLNHVVTDLNLPNKGENGSTISWTSGDESVVSVKGTVQRPSSGSDNEQVTLTITISMGDATPLIRSFTVTVRAFGLSDPEMVDADYLWLTDDIIKNSNSSLNMVISDLYLPKKGEMHGSHISWGSDDIDVVDISGKVTRPSFGEENNTVKLTATISIGYAPPREITFTVTVKALEQTHEEKVKADAEWLKSAVILGDENSDINNVTGDLSLPTVGVNGSNIRWESSNTAIIEVFYYKGIVTRPVSPQGDETVTLTASITSGDAPAVTKTFTLVVKARPKTDEEKLREDYELLMDTVILNENSALNHITEDVNLPGTGENGSDISWSSTDTTFVDTDGTVKRPTYTQGNQTVTLTAAISIGTEAPLTKTFELVIKALDQTPEEKDAEIVNADYKWLVETIILNGNSTVKEITGDLNLPDIGENGSIISWQSSHPEVVDINGRVTRSIDGDKDVTLTATISKGSAKKVQWFYITVIKRHLTDEEIVAKDYEWLTEELVLNGNSSVDNVTCDLYLPTRGVLGASGSLIRWETSKPAYVALDGKIYRPIYFLGDMTVTLTATITMDFTSLTKTFTFIVKCADMTDEQSVSEDAKWLYRNYNVLGGNPSRNSVVENLSCPKLGPYGSTITWHSDNTDVISHEGVVTRPENGDGNKLVRVTATVTKGKEQSEVPYLCIVLQKPDLSAPVVTSTTPANGSTDVFWNTNQISVIYNEDIVLAQSHGIVCEASGTVQVRVSTDGKRLIITPVTAFSSGENKLLIPAGAVIDTAGNPADTYELKFTVEEKLVRNIEVIDSLPLNNQKGVDPNLIVMSFHFDDSAEIVKRPRFDYKVTLLSRDKIIPITYSLTGNKVTITLKELGESLALGTIYRIIISEGLVQDRFYNKNKETIIEFMTEVQTTEEEVPEIFSIYPADGQTGVSVRPNIEVLFSDEYELDSYRFKLTDSSGKEYLLYAPHTLDFTDFIKTKLIFIPKEMLEPNTVYTLSGPYKTVTDPDSREFSIQFTTGSGPRVTKTSPSTGDWDAPTRGIVEIYFDEPVTRGDNFSDIAFLDFANDPVKFVVEEAGNKVVLRAVSELELYMPYSVYIPYGAFKNSKGVANTQYKITFYTSLERLPYDLSPSYLDVSDIGFVRKSFKLSCDTFNMATWLNFVRMMGYGPVSYEWYIDGEPIGTSQICYYNFSNPGKYKVTFIAKDKYGYSYSVSKTVEIQDLQDVRMTLKDSGMLRYIHLTETDTQSELKFELRLEQDDHFIYGERIGVKLYKDSILQPLSNYGDGGITITSNYNDNVYMYTYKPEYGDDGTYEVVFTYNGVNGEQVIREPFIVTSKEPATTNVFRFRLYENKLARYYEELSYVHVVLNGEILRANREMYTYDGSTFPVYTLRKTLQSNTYYDFNVENWNWDKGYGPFYLGRDTDNPAIFTGNLIPLASWEEMRITSVVTNHLESELNAENNDTYFEGLPTKLVFNVEGDWADFGKGYYEIATLKIGAGVSRYGDTGFKIIHTQAHDDGSDIQKITVQPGIQLESNLEQYWIRMVSSQGYKSSWEMCPHLWLMPRPSVLGKKLNISVIDGEYAMNWPTVFNGPIGGVIKALDGIPVLDGGSFGLGGGMPKFEGGMSTGTEIELSFHAKGGYGSSKKTKQPTQYKKVKKITIVSYEFNIELEGGVHLVYNWFSKEWGINNLYIMFDASAKKKWDKGFDFKIVEITAGVHVGAGIYGYIEVKNEEEDLDYRGIIRLYPNAGLYVDGSFGPYKVKGRLNAILPAEIHFPTGYIGVDFNVDASIKARTLLWSGTLYEEDLYKVHWDNGKEMVTRLATGNPMEETRIGEDTEFQLIPRDYLSRQSNWLGGNNYSLTMQNADRLNGFDTLGTDGEANPGIFTIMPNIYPEAEIALVKNGDQQWIVWTDDNPLRDAVNRTQLRLAVFKDGILSDTKFIYDDGTADFTPSVAAVEDGVLMVWHNIARGISEEEGPNEMLTSSEIGVTKSVYPAEGDAPDIMNLTDDDKLDHSPMLVANGHKALLVWTKSENIGFSLGIEEGSSSLPGDQFYFSTWSNDTWSEAEAINMEPSTILDSHLVMAGEKALLLCTLDKDHNFSTDEDREVFAIAYDGNTWGEAIRLTHNNVSDYGAKAVYIDEKWFITWLREGKIVYQIGLDGEPRDGEWQDNIQGDYQIVVKKGERPMVSLVYTQPGEDMALGIYASFYDFNYGLWSDKAGLVTEDIYTNAFSAFFAENGKLHAAYTEADIITEAKPRTIDGKEELIEGKSISDKVDLKMLIYTPVHDVALSEEDGMFLSTAFPLARTVTKVYTTVRNEGDFTENIVVSLYNGNPEEGGVEVAKTAPQPIPAHSSKEVEIEWLVGPEERMEYDLYAVVRLIDEVEEINTDNNTISMNVATSDVAIMNVTCKNAAADDYLIEVTITNRGSTVLDGVKVWLEDEFGEIVAEIATLKTLELGKKSVLTYMLQSNGRKNMSVRVTLPDGEMEDNTDNNVWNFKLEPASFMLSSLNIGPGDKQVDVTSPIILNFNMIIGEGSGFDRIQLIDEVLNDVAISKTIENNTLTIKPQQQLEYGIGYRLVIPEDALGDSYGHALERALNISFTTMTTNPEIISAYPGDRMNNLALNAVIRLRFNQNVVKGNEFSEIVLNELVDGSAAKAIPILASIEGELLTIRFVQKLNKNTAYTLEIPRGAVENSREEIPQEDYLLVFTTGDEDVGDDEGDEGDEDDGGDKGDKDDGDDEDDKDDKDDGDDEGIVENESGGDGRDGDDDSGGQPSSDSQQYQASINIDGTEKAIEVRIEDRKAVIELGELASEIFTGNQKTIVNIPSISDINSCTVEMPAEALSSPGTSSMTVNTPWGSVTIPFGMLSTMKGNSGKTAGITIAAGDRTKLPEEVKAAIGDRPILQLTLTLDGVKTAWNNPSAPVIVSIPYTPTAAEEESLESIVIWYIDVRENIITIPNGHYRQSTGGVSFSTTHFSDFAVAFEQVHFKDVPDGAWYDVAVSFIAAREITRGTGNGNFSPDNRLTRAEAITLIMRTYGIAPNTNPMDNFSDAGYTWYTGYLAAAKRLGISKGIGNNLFAPDIAITRQEMFTLFYNALGAVKQLPSDTVNSGKTLSDFTDARQIDFWAREAMTLLVETGIVEGNAGKLMPLNTATRAEMAQMLYNLMTIYNAKMFL